MEPAVQVRAHIPPFLTRDIRFNKCVLTHCLCLCCGKDVNECEDPSFHACVPHTTCVDTIGNYTCSCDSRFNIGDSRMDGLGCKLSPMIRMMIIVENQAQHIVMCEHFLSVFMYIIVFLAS